MSGGQPGRTCLPALGLAFAVPPGWLPRPMPKIRRPVLSQPVDLIGNSKVGDEANRAKDLLGRVYTTSSRSS